jgi:hypothetical protein
MQPAATIGPDPAPWYVDELTKLGRNAADFYIAQLRLAYLAETEDRAWEEAQAHIFSMMEFYGEILAEANDAPGDKEVFLFKSPRELRNSPFGRAAKAFHIIAPVETTATVPIEPDNRNPDIESPAADHET